MFTPSLIKKLSSICLLLISFGAKAQQVKKIDCCKDVSPKATIIINNGTSSNNSSATVSTNPTNGIFNFELKSNLNTSAGVYNSDGVLVRTLWGGVRYDAGCYEAQWDGLLDDGTTQAPFGNYTIKILTNNVQYTWEGGIGDSSTEPFTNRKLRANDYNTFVTVGSMAYAGAGYSEHETALKTFNLSDINLPNAPSGQTEMNIVTMATDGNLIYVAGDKAFGDNKYASWVHAIHPGDVNLSQNPVAFASRQSIIANSGSGDLTDNYAISLYNPNTSDYSGYINSIAVQKTGNFLFVARSGLNQLQVLDKRVSSGAVLQTLSYNLITAVASDANTFLYVVTNGTIKKLIVNSNGTLTNTGTSFTGINSVSKLAYSNELNKLAVFDNSTNQIKIYNPSGGEPVQIVGTAGGYSSSPYFNVTRFVDANFLYYQQDGTLWLGQPALHSILHYNLDFSIKEESQHLPTSRCTAVDQNNPTRVFANYNEYTRDYSKTLDNGSNGSWKLAANWVKGADVSNSNYDGIVWACTLSNAKTYALIYTGGRNQLNELTATGARFISDYFSGDIGRDGTLYQYGDNGSGGRQITGIYKRMLTGFDSSNNPVWDNATLWIANPAGNTFYTPWYGYQNKTTGLTAAADKYIYFNNGTTADRSLDRSGNTVGYMLGAVQANTQKPLWKSARTTLYNYSGPYPANGDFDIGNNNGYYPQHSETHAMTYDNDVFWNINGEFWQNTEANFWNHLDANTGLLIGHFGTNGNISKLLPGDPEMAGNAFSTAMAKVGSDYYIYHCDESVHAFIHSWHVSGLNTVQIITIPINLTNAVIQLADNTNLMAGVPYKSNSFFGGNGWTMNPSAGINDDPSNYYPTWRIITTKNSYRAEDNDIFIESSGNVNGSYRTVSRTLGTNNTNNWILSGQFKINSNLNDNYSLDILDAAGKNLVHLRTQYSVILLQGSFYQQNSLNANLLSFTFLPFKVQNINGTVSVSVNGLPAVTVSSYESGGNFNTPATFQIRAGGNGDNNHTIMSIKGLRFSKN